jgi:hypothetical protein
VVAQVLDYGSWVRPVRAGFAFPEPYDRHKRIFSKSRASDSCPRTHNESSRHE